MNLKDFSLSAVVAGLLAVFISFAGPVAIVFQAARLAGLSDAMTSSWIWAISLGSGIAGLLLSYRLKVEPVSQRDAETAAESWERGSGLSLGDRLCLALARRLDVPVLTADRAWGESERIEQLRR